MDELYHLVTEVGINFRDIVDYYEEIDAFSRGKHRTRHAHFPAIKMGKNDLWIVATAAAFEIPLVTTDKDFDHLAGEFLELVLLNVNDYRTNP